MSYAVLEAMAAGRCVLTSDVQGARELIESPHAGEIIARTDVNRWVFTLVKYLKDPGVADALGEVGRKKVDENYRLEPVLLRHRHAILSVATPV